MVNMRLQDFFENVSRSDGSTFPRLTENAPDWLRAAVYKAHDGCMPDDVIYDICWCVAAAIDEGAESADDASVSHYSTHEQVDALARLSWHADVADACHSDSGPDHANLWSRVNAAFGQAQLAIGQRFFDAVTPYGHCGDVTYQDEGADS